MEEVIHGKNLENFFEVDATNIARLAIYSLFRKGDISKKRLHLYIKN